MPWAGRSPPSARPDRQGDRVDLRALLRRGGSAPAPRELREVHLSLFCMEHAMARTLMDLGIRPAALLGHSLGEWVAAVLAGVVGPEDAMAAVARRADLVETAGPGAMLSVLAAAEEVERYAVEDTWIAAENGPGHCVFSGRPEAVSTLARPTAGRGVHHVARGRHASLPHTAVGGRRRPARRGSAPRGPGAGPHPHRVERARHVAGREGTRTRLLA
ncbi:acyltransferase domain-containing protein [Streptomyces indonesiensis]